MAGVDILNSNIVGTRMGKCSVGWGAQVKSKSQHGVVWKNGLGEFG